MFVRRFFIVFHKYIDFMKQILNNLNKVELVTKKFEVLLRYLFYAQLAFLHSNNFYSCKMYM